MSRINHIKFSVIIVAYNNFDVLINCLKSVYKYNDIGEELEVIIIDNSSDEEIYNYIKKHYCDVIIKKNNNKGFGEGNNQGARIAKGEYILFLNPDTILVEPIFQFAINKFENNNNLALFGLQLVDIDMNKNLSFYLIDKWGIIYTQITKLCNKLNIFIDGKMFISGANMFIRKNIFELCGMFDENIFMYYEESDLVKRVKKFGIQTSYFKSKKIIHLEGKTSENIEKALRRRLKSAQYYTGKYGLNFNKQLKSEIRYNKLKLIIYKLIRNSKYDVQSKYIKTFYEFMK